MTFIDTQLNTSIKQFLFPGAGGSNRPKYVRVPDALSAIPTKDLSHGEKWVLARMLHHIGSEGRCFLSQGRIALLIGLSRTRVCDLCNTLRTKGLIDWMAGDGDTNEYQLTQKLFDLLQENSERLKSHQSKISHQAPVGISTGGGVGTPNENDVDIPTASVQQPTPPVENPTKDVEPSTQTKSSQEKGSKRKANNKNIDVDLLTWAKGVYTMGMGYFIQAGQNPTAYPPQDNKTLNLLQRFIKLLGNGNHRLAAQKFELAMRLASTKFNQAGDNGWRVKFLPTPKRICNMELIAELIGEYSENDFEEIAETATGFLEQSSAWSDQWVAEYNEQQGHPQPPSVQRESPTQKIPDGYYVNEHGLICRHGSI